MFIFSTWLFLWLRVLIQNLQPPTDYILYSHQIYGYHQFCLFHFLIRISHNQDVCNTVSATFIEAVSYGNYQSLTFRFFNSLFQLTSKEMTKLHVIVLSEGNLRPVDFPHKGVNIAERVSFHVMMSSLFKRFQCQIYFTMFKINVYVETQHAQYFPQGFRNK